MSTNLTKKDLRELTAFATDLAEQAGRALRRGFSRKMKIAFKGRIDPVTEYDLKSEKMITDKISRTFPDHAILSEEGASESGQSGLRWIIDPLDGTVNYAHGFPFYCVSLGLERDGELLLGVVYDPERKEMFTAARSSGANLNGKKIHVSTEQKLVRALLATGFAYDIGSARRNNLGLFARMAKKAQGIRRPGSAALDLCWLAAGRIDGFWELCLRPWDTAAAVLIVAEAGGRVSRFDRRPFRLDDKDLLASNGLLHTAMSKVLSGHGNSTPPREG